MARAWCLIYGNGVPQDHNGCFRMLSTECDASDPHVQFLLGFCHQFQFGCAKSHAQAAQCYERAGNHVGALTFLGILLWNGLNGAAPDDARAAVLFRQAAEQGDRIAQCYVAMMYEHGRAVTKDLQQAKYWYTLAIRNGYQSALKALQRILSEQKQTGDSGHLT
eukprot:TRINITY_DN5412_c0_g1_i1.p1 TRINITY_DN5412_c0_g1~~TRINITY_DN5412_c0_g1_i1.p1  ORF type:complete len:181 (-),score=29.74 TRINITY_DN5412_c0_g1_i1:245-736(-)